MSLEETGHLINNRNSRISDAEKVLDDKERLIMSSTTERKSEGACHYDGKGLRQG